MRRGASSLLLVLLAFALVPLVPADHAEGCACPGGSCRCDHSSAETCGSAGSSSDCAMDACDKLVAPSPLPAVVFATGSGTVGLPREARADRASRPRSSAHCREIADPPPRPSSL